MDIEEALTTYLMAQAGLTALIARRFSFDEVPETAQRPYVSAMQISGVPDHGLSGQYKLESPFYQFTVFADSPPNARAVATQLKTALSDYHGTLSGVVIQKIELQNELYATYTGEAPKAYTAYLEYQIFFEKE